MFYRCRLWIGAWTVIHKKCATSSHLQTYLFMAAVCCSKKWQEGKQTAVTRTPLTLEMLPTDWTATCSEQQEHFTILSEQYSQLYNCSTVSCTIHIIYTPSTVSHTECNILLLYKNLAYVFKDWPILGEVSGRTAGLQADIWTKDLSSRKQGCCSHSLLSTDVQLLIFT
jgi:hypothetical protein